MWNGKLKAVTFSFDDANHQDKKVIEILDKYNLKGTFNLNSGNLGKAWRNAAFNGVTADCSKISAKDVKEVYKNHEVAAHTVNHPLLTKMSDEEIIYQVEQDRLALSELVGYDVVGFAYPNGYPNADERVARVIREHTGVKYARTVKFTWNFDLPKDLYLFDPSVYQTSIDRCIELAKEFVQMKTDKPQMFYVMGHSYEVDLNLLTWEKFEQLCSILANKQDIFYGTNKQVLLGE